MKLHSENDLAQALVGTQREPWVFHAKSAIDSRAGLSMDLLKCAVEAGSHDKWRLTDLVASVCDLSAHIHAEWEKRGWTIPTPPMDTTDDNPVGFERK